MSQLASMYNFQPGYSQRAAAALQAANGDFLLAGSVSQQNGSSMGLVLRIRADGNLVWAKNYPGPFSTFFSSIAALPDGTFVLTGTYFTSNLSGAEKTWMVHLDGAGSVLWEEQYGEPKYQY